jgi:hypothetical protein
MSITVHVTIEVEDFDACLEQFIAAAPTRSSEPTIYREIDNPNKAHIISDRLPSKEAFIEEFRSPKRNAIKKGKQKAGNTSFPVVIFLEKVLHSGFE